MESLENTDGPGDKWCLSYEDYNTSDGVSTSLHETSVSLNKVSLNGQDQALKSKSWGPSGTQTTDDIKSGFKNQKDNSNFSLDNNKQTVSQKDPSMPCNVSVGSKNSHSLESNEFGEVERDSQKSIECEQTISDNGDLSETKSSNEKDGANLKGKEEQGGIHLNDSEDKKSGELERDSQKYTNERHMKDHGNLRETRFSDKNNYKGANLQDEEEQRGNHLYDSTHNDNQQYAEQVELQEHQGFKKNKQSLDVKAHKQQEIVDHTYDIKHESAGRTGNVQNIGGESEKQGEVYSNEDGHRGSSENEQGLGIGARKKQQSFVDHYHNVRGGSAGRKGNLQNRDRRGHNRVQGPDVTQEKNFSNQNEPREVTTDSKKSEEQGEDLYRNDHRDMFEFFWRGSSPFSQWYRSKFYVDGNRFCTAEQYMMYQKAVLFGDDEIAEKILRTKDPREQKNLGRKVKNFKEDIWQEHCVAVVKNGNKAKFSDKNNIELKEALYGTIGKILVEASPLDTIWGIGLSEDDPMAWSRATWQGENLLGYALTEVRDEMMKEDGLMDPS